MPLEPTDEQIKLQGELQVASFEIFSLKERHRQWGAQCRWVG